MLPVSAHMLGWSAVLRKLRAHPHHVDRVLITWCVCIHPACLAAPAQLYKDAGVPTKNFVGVPVFQAEGLTVTTQDMVRGAGAQWWLQLGE